MAIVLDGSSSAGLLNLGTNGTISNLAAGGLPDDSINLADLSATGTASASTFLRGDNSWAEAGGGTILQYQHAAGTTSSNTSGTTWVDTVCTDTITTTKLNSKIWVTATFVIFHMKDTNDSRGGTRLRRDEGGADEFIDSDSKGMYYRKDGNDANQNNNCRFQFKSHHSWIDSPGKSAGTSITYDLQIAAQSTASNQYISIQLWDMQLWELDV